MTQVSTDYARTGAAAMTQAERGAAIERVRTSLAMHDADYLTQPSMPDVVELLRAYDALTALLGQAFDPEHPTQAQINAVAEVFNGTADDPVARGSAYIMTKKLMRALAPPVIAEQREVK